jgi:hypothetical protein
VVREGITTRQYARLVSEWIASIGLDPHLQPHSLLSIARLNIAKSRVRPSTCSLVRGEYVQPAARQRVVKEAVRTGPVVSAPINHLAMFTDYIDPGERLAVCPHQDVVYGITLLALDRSPVIVQVPDFGDRFWVYAAYDARTDAFKTLKLGADGSLTIYVRLAGQRQRVQLATGTQEWRVFALCPRLLAEGGNHVRLMDATGSAAGELWDSA